MAVVLLVLEQQILMPFVLKCDVDSIRHILHQLESELSKKNSIYIYNILSCYIKLQFGTFYSTFFHVAEHQIPTVLSERCDGNRNVLHACVSMCMPTSNKEPDVNSGNYFLLHRFLYYSYF